VSTAPASVSSLVTWGRGWGNGPGPEPLRLSIIWASCPCSEPH
jgi:hypothetical protein